MTLCTYSSMSSFKHDIYNCVHTIVMNRQKPSIYISTTNALDKVIVYKSKYENGIECTMNTSAIRKLTHEINMDILECIEYTPEYYICIGSVNYNDSLVNLDIIYSPGCLGICPNIVTIKPPSIYSRIFT